MTSSTTTSNGGGRFAASTWLPLARRSSATSSCSPGRSPILPIARSWCSRVTTDRLQRDSRRATLTFGTDWCAHGGCAPGRLSSGSGSPRPGTSSAQLATPNRTGHRSGPLRAACPRPRRSMQGVVDRRGRVRPSRRPSMREMPASPPARCRTATPRTTIPEFSVRAGCWSERRQPDWAHVARYQSAARSPTKRADGRR
jgi:hypothetical protein